jgi:hypothetical protein
METGRPDDPVLQGYEQDLTKYKPDMSAQMSEAQRQLAMQGGGAQRQLLAGMSKMGPAGTMTADVGRRMGDISAQTDYNQRKAAADLEMQSLDMGMKQMDAINRAREAANRLKVDEYNRAAQEFNNEQQGRGGFVKGLLGTVGTIGGGIAGGVMGGPMGAAAGASMGGSLANLVPGGGGMVGPMGYGAGPNYGDMGMNAYELYKSLGSSPMTVGNGSYGSTWPGQYGLGNQATGMPQGLSPELLKMLNKV